MYRVTLQGSSEFAKMMLCFKGETLFYGMTIYFHPTPVLIRFNMIGERSG